MLLSEICIYLHEENNGEAISRGEAECNLAISECNYIQNCSKKHVIT